MRRSLKARLLAEFDREHRVYEDLARNVAALVERILSESSVQVHSVTWRCKTRESFSAKLDKPSATYRTISDITDIAAMRVTTYFSDDVDRAAEMLSSEFEVDAANSVDKRAVLDADRFGYQSVHVVVGLSPSRRSLVENSRFRSLKMEVQIRSILQHAWAEIEHDFGYKSSEGLPRQVRRRFARVAGLLELADDEFVAIRNELTKYAESVVADIESNPAGVELNYSSLKALYQIESKVKALDQAVAVEMGKTVDDDVEKVTEDFVTRLAAFGIRTVEALEKVAENYHDLIVNFAAYWIALPDEEGDCSEHGDSASTDTGIGLFYLIYVLLWQSGDRDTIERYFRECSIGEEVDKTRYATELLAFPG